MTISKGQRFEVKGTSSTVYVVDRITKSNGRTHIDAVREGFDRLRDGFRWQTSSAFFAEVKAGSIVIL